MLYTWLLHGSKLEPRSIDEKYTMGLQRPEPLQKGSGVQTLFELGGGGLQKRVWQGRVVIGLALPGPCLLQMLQRALEFLIFTSVEHTSVATF